MRTFRIIVAWILTILAVVGVIVVLAGLVGSWIVRNRVTDVTVELLTVGETAVTMTSDGVNRVDDRLDESLAIRPQVRMRKTIPEVFGNTETVGMFLKGLKVRHPPTSKGNMT